MVTIRLLKILSIAATITLIQACVSKPTKTGSGFTPSEIRSVIGSVQQAVHLASGTLETSKPPVSLSSAKLELNSTSSLNESGEVSLFVVNSNASNSEGFSEGLIIDLSASPIPVDSQLANTYGTAGVKDASESGRYYVLNADRSPETSAGRLALLITNSVKGIATSESSVNPFELKQMQMIIGFTLTRTAGAGVGLPLDPIEIGISGSQSRSRTNKITLTFKPAK